MTVVASSGSDVPSATSQADDRIADPVGPRNDRRVFYQQTGAQRQARSNTRKMPMRQYGMSGSASSNASFLGLATCAAMGACFAHGAIQDQRQAREQNSSDIQFNG